MSKRRKKLVIKDHATGWQKSRGKGRTHHGGKSDPGKYKSLGRRKR